MSPNVDLHNWQLQEGAYYLTVKAGSVIDNKVASVAIYVSSHSTYFEAVDELLSIIDDLKTSGVFDLATFKPSESEDHQSFVATATGSASPDSKSDSMVYYVTITERPVV